MIHGEVSKEAFEDILEECYKAIGVPDASDNEEESSVGLR